MTRSATDRSELEERVRAALRARAEATPVATPDRFAPGPALSLEPVDVDRRRRRAALAVGGGAAAAAVLVVAALVARDGDGDVTTDSDRALAGEGAVEAPSGSRWFVLDLPGVTFHSSHSESRPGSTGGVSSVQAFRSDAGFAGPMVWVDGGSSFGEEAPGVSEVTVQGQAAYLRQDGDVVMLSWPGGGDDGVDVLAVGLSADDVVALAEGLRPGDGAGWETTALPGGLAEVAAEDPATADPEYAEWDYTGPGGATYELFVNPGGAATFEGRAREHVANGGTVEPVSVDGRPGLIVAGEGESVAVWRPTDEVVVDLRTSGSRDELVTALEALRPVDEATWAAQSDPVPDAGG